MLPAWAHQVEKAEGSRHHFPPNGVLPKLACVKHPNPPIRCCQGKVLIGWGKCCKDTVQTV